MKKGLLLICIVYILITLIGCNKTTMQIPENDEILKDEESNDNEDNEAVIEYIYGELSVEDKLLLEIELIYSPDRQHYFIVDYQSAYHNVYLCKASEAEGEIVYDFVDFVKNFYGLGYEEIYNLNLYSLDFFWGPDSQYIYLVDNGNRFFRYSLSSKEWEKVEHNTNIKNLNILFFIKEDQLLITDLNDETWEFDYYIYNIGNHEIKLLPQLLGFKLTNKCQNKLFMYKPVRKENEYDFIEVIFDLESELLTELELPFYQYYEFGDFYPEESSVLAYFIYKDRKTYLILYNYITDEYKEIFIGEGFSRFYGWNQAGTGYLSDSNMVYPTNIKKNIDTLK